MQRSDEADPVKLIENMDVWADVWMQEVAPNMHHVTSNGVAPTCATPNEPTLDGWADVWMQEFAERGWPTHGTSNGVAPTYAPSNGDLSRAVQLSVDANAVRAFMLSQTKAKRESTATS